MKKATEEWRGNIEWWWSPYKIIYTHNQLIWLLNHIRELRVSDWPPPNRNASGYTEWQFAQYGNRYKEYARMVESIAGNVERRLLKTSMDGAMAYLVYTCGLGYGEVAMQFHITSNETVNRVDSAIRYCEGKADRKEPYNEWKLVRETLHKKLVRGKNRGA